MNYNITNQNVDKITKWIQEGKSARWVAKQLGCAPSSVRCFLKKRGLKSQHKCKVDYNNLLKDRADEVVNLYNSGKTCDEISEITGHSGAQISVLLKNSQYEIRDWKYSVNERFFDAVTCEAVAYVLGWFYSDGCVDNQGKMRIQIQKGDEEILYIIKELMGYNGPLYEVPPPKRFPHRKAQVTLCINRKTLADNLIRLGCTPNKSLTLQYPHSIIPDRLRSHFIRGVFDGDGSISVKQEKYLNISITSSEAFLQPLRDFLLEELNIPTKHYYRYSHTNTMQMMITRTKDAEKFLEWIYQDATYYLTRKFQKYQQHLKNSV
jgi:DNA-binding CsgD family transcriptional regulator